MIAVVDFNGGERIFAASSFAKNPDESLDIFDGDRLVGHAARGWYMVFHRDVLHADIRTTTPEQAARLEGAKQVPPDGGVMGTVP